MATSEGGVRQDRRPTMEMTDVMELADNLGAALVVALVLQVCSVLVGLVTAGLIGWVVGFGLTLGVAVVPLAAIGWAYLNSPRRTEGVLRRVGRVLVVVYALWGIALFGAYAFGAHLSGMPAVLTPPPQFYHPIEVAGIYLAPVVGALGATRYVVALKT